jgi:hypothetical protein
VYNLFIGGESHAKWKKEKTAQDVHAQEEKKTAEKPA